MMNTYTTEKVLDKNRLNQSDSFIRDNMSLLTCKRCDAVLLPNEDNQACACGNAFYCKDC